MHNKTRIKRTVYFFWVSHPKSSRTRPNRTELNDTSTATEHLCFLFIWTTEKRPSKVRPERDWQSASVRDARDAEQIDLSKTWNEKNIFLLCGSMLFIPSNKSVSWKYFLPLYYSGVNEKNAYYVLKKKHVYKFRIFKI